MLNIHKKTLDYYKETQNNCEEMQNDYRHKTRDVTTTKRQKKTQRDTNGPQRDTKQQQSYEQVQRDTNQPQIEPEELKKEIQTTTKKQNSYHDMKVGTCRSTARAKSPRYQQHSPVNQKFKNSRSTCRKQSVHIFLVSYHTSFNTLVL